MPTTAAHRVPYLQKPLHLIYSLLFLTFWVYTACTTPDLLNWITENTLTLSFLICLIAFYNIFRFSDTSYTLIFLFLMLHVYGSQYQYAENPLGEWLQQIFHLQRNHYDRLVHFTFGLLLAYPMLETFIFAFKAKPLWSYLLVIQTTLALAALYELVEWAVADLVYGGNRQATDYLGMQGDIWDAQKDMALALLGAALAMTAVYLLQRFRRF
ncbi:DUF2238 domain-containing protein [Pontibacter sp. 172403-2]|uniref:DUF2238 domain-containing protein n=1 Tax=Pontibacter rufus TaxID=2791028 RepID=UPI0018AFD194|nr:DUF2238 domain-containing protein [Pontibacter sp. 172403-2]MBF9253496.1 DUF2238 domain-containing protein [Pontibacter sp. 172403-2]